MFQGQFYTCAQCLRCQYKHNSFDSFLSITLSLEEDLFKSVDLNKCLDKFTKTIIIPKSEGFKCSACKIPVDIKKTMVIWRLPPVLILHLKRFTCSTYIERKLTTKIDFDIDNFDMKPYCGESSTTV